MSADAISRLITNITLVMRSGMRHTRTVRVTNVAESGVNREMAMVVNERCDAQLDRDSLLHLIPAGIVVKYQQGI
ncbi:hypothetical protein VZT92_024456 [Zoarces viviparus]|uniref:Uncharacterized protein n=1 Tax=Zoarces viviparus TaxID=48416 RepID=A0AAW1E2W9_ZOAVI